MKKRITDLNYSSLFALFEGKPRPTIAANEHHEYNQFMGMCYDCYLDRKAEIHNLDKKEIKNEIR